MSAGRGHCTLHLILAPLRQASSAIPLHLVTAMTIIESKEDLPACRATPRWPANRQALRQPTLISRFSATPWLSRRERHAMTTPSTRVSSPLAHSSCCHAVLVRGHSLVLGPSLSSAAAAAATRATQPARHSTTRHDAPPHLSESSTAVMRSRPPAHGRLRLASFLHTAPPALPLIPPPPPIPVLPSPSLPLRSSPRLPMLALLSSR